MMIHIQKNISRTLISQQDSSYGNILFMIRTLPNLHKFLEMRLLNINARNKILCYNLGKKRLSKNKLILEPNSHGAQLYTCSTNINY
jgi:hypothetical protein